MSLAADLAPLCWTDGDIRIAGIKALADKYKSSIEFIAKELDIEETRIPWETPPEIASSGAPAKEATPAEPFPLLRIRDIPEIVEQDWLIEGLFPLFPEGAAGYIFGPAKGRKSMMLADAALSVTSGTPALGKFPVRHRGTAVGFFAEDPKGETSRRIHRMARARGIEVPENLYLIGIPRLSLDNAEHQDRLMATLRGVDDLRFVFFDPMVRMHSVNDNKAEEIGPIHGYLRELSRNLPGTVLALAHHTNQSGGARGSTDYPAFGDFNIYVDKPDGMTTEIKRIEFRSGGEPAPFCFRIEDGGTKEAPTLALTVSEVEQAQERREVALEEEIIAYKATHPGTSGRKCIEHLKYLGMKFKDKTFWELWNAPPF